ncbi:MAG: hypothetical protein ACK4FJ_03555 [Ferrovibrio sp.]|uniref:hypothetical protein n=1 Tax=Ferrovibrio sp. TaxID=1917215 RepID=UPI003919D389
MPTCLEFIAKLRLNQIPGHIVGLELPSKTTFSFPSNELNRLAERAEAVGLTSQIYYAPGIQAVAPGPRQRGGSASVCGIPGFWWDGDILGPGHKQTALPTEKQIKGFIISLPMKPSAVVWTGGGVHCYWLFEKPWVFSDEADRQKAAAMLAGWQRRIIELGSRHGWKFDFTGDLARVLRLPGTWNLKIPGQPRPVTVEYWSDENALQH